MPEDTSKFRERIVDTAEGLTREDTRHAFSAGGLLFERLQDAAADESMQLTPVSDQVLVPDPENDTALSYAGVGLLLAEHTSGRVRELLEKARSLIVESQWRSALLAVDQAIAADGTSGEAWALKGACLTKLGLFEAALRVLQYARGHVSDPEVRIRILRLEADCVHTSTVALESRLGELAEKGQAEDALKLVTEGLRAQPSNIVFLYHHARLLWLSGDDGGARRALQEAQKHSGRESADLIADLERTIEFGAHISAVEAARSALRRKDAAEALRLLDGCAAALAGNEQFEGLRTYAEGKRRTLGQFLGTRKAGPPAGSAQRTLRWLLADELREADAALRAGNLERARHVLEAAGQIDANCGAVLYRHARAITAAGARASADELRQADALATRAGESDPDYLDLAQSLLAGIRETRRRVG
jgi:tetratricopeptide (TPR) repeat protein